MIFIKTKMQNNIIVSLEIVDLYLRKCNLIAFYHYGNHFGVASGAYAL